MSTVVTGPSFIAGAATYEAPSAGTFRFATFNERDARLAFASVAAAIPERPTDKETS